MVIRQHTLARAFISDICACKDSPLTLSQRVQFLCTRYLRPLMQLYLGNTLTWGFICLFQKGYDAFVPLVLLYPAMEKITICITLGILTMTSNKTFALHTTVLKKKWKLYRLQYIKYHLIEISYRSVDATIINNCDIHFSLLCLYFNLSNELLYPLQDDFQAVKISRYLKKCQFKFFASYRLDYFIYTTM